MPTTTNIGISLMPTNPSAPETIYSQAMQRVEDCLTAILTVDCTAGGTITLSQMNTQKYGGYALSGTPAAGFNLALDSSITGKAPFMVNNQTGKTVTVKIGTGSATVIITTGTVSHCRVTDANSIYEVAAVGGGGSSTVADISFLIDGGGSTITTGLKGYIEIPFNCTINRATLLGDRSGSIVVNVWKTTYSSFDAGSTHPLVGDKITASAPPTISSATKSQDSTLTGWTTSISADDILAFNVDSVTSLQRVTLSLKVTKT